MNLLTDEDHAPHERPPHPLQALVSGSGPQILLLHAFGSSPYVYQPTIDLLSRHGQVIAPWWLRVRSRTWTFQRAVDCLAKLLDDLSPEPALVIGHSYGGAIAAGLAAQHPDKVEHLVLANAFVLSPGRDVLRKLALPGRHLLRLASWRGFRGFVDQLWTRPRNLASAGWWGYSLDMEDEVDALARAEVPVTVAWAEDDIILDRALGRRLAERTGGEFVGVQSAPGGVHVGHDWVFRTPTLFVNTLNARGILSSRPARSANEAASG